MLDIIIITILFFVTIACVLYINKKNRRPLEKGIISIIIDNQQVKKTKTADRQEIINEAEALFKTLQRKYLYSPLPFKVLGDFYADKGLNDKAIEKYSQMVRYLNKELSLIKLERVMVFLKENNALREVGQIEGFYNK
ncbi:MAG: hypothetical protein PHV30_01645 [Candidatus Margulisbacteria bacterium]|nr:hypothetical protein [Candidatus Margulisiibacteriota bacterium]